MGLTQIKNLSKPVVSEANLSVKAVLSVSHLISFPRLCGDINSPQDIEQLLPTDKILGNVQYKKGCIIYANNDILLSRKPERF